MFQEKLYKYDQATLKNYGHGKYKITLFKCLRTSGLEVEKQYTPKYAVNEEKLETNISRSKAKIFELAYCNEWTYFFTATLNKNKHNRYDLKSFNKNIGQFIRDYNKKFDLDIKYLLVPEKHKDGAWHLHGLLYGVPENNLSLFTLSEKLPNHIRDKLKNGDKVYNWNDYFKKFGYCELEPVRSHEAVSKYITKYITKELLNSVTELGGHLYYRSRDLKLAETIKKGTMSVNIEPDYENDFVKIMWVDSILANLYCNKIIADNENKSITTYCANPCITSIESV